MDIKMFRIRHILSVVVVVLLLSSCDFKDNYEGPNAAFAGRLIDVTSPTGESLISEQPNGFQLAFKEVSWSPTSELRTFWGQYDGSFSYSYIFGYEGPTYEGSPYTMATYEIYPRDGAFVLESGVETIQVKAGATAEVDFYVTPFVTLTQEHKLDLQNNTVTVTYSMKRNVANKVYARAGVIISGRTKFLSAVNDGGWDAKYTRLVDVPSSYNDGDEITVTIPLDKKCTYWIRVGALVKGTSRWNYSKIVEIKVP